MNYSKELKDALLRRMLPPNNESITKISKEHYVPDPGNMFVMQEGEAYSRMTFGITFVLYFILSYTTIYYPTLQMHYVPDPGKKRSLERMAGINWKMKSIVDTASPR